MELKGLLLVVAADRFVVWLWTPQISWCGKSQCQSQSPVDRMRAERLWFLFCDFLLGAGAVVMTQLTLNLKSFLLSPYMTAEVS